MFDDTTESDKEIEEKQSLQLSSSKQLSRAFVYSLERLQTKRGKGQHQDERIVRCGLAGAAQGRNIRSVAVKK